MKEKPEKQKKTSKVMPQRRKPKSSTGDGPLPNESIFYGTTVDELVSAMDKEDGFEGHPEDSETESDSSEDEESQPRIKIASKTTAKVQVGGGTGTIGG